MRYLILALLFALAGVVVTPAEAVVKCSCRPSGATVVSE